MEKVLHVVSSGEVFHSGSTQFYLKGTVTHGPKATIGKCVKVEITPELLELLNSHMKEAKRSLC